MHGYRHVLPRLNEFIGVVLSCSTHSRFDCLNGSITHTTGRLAYTIVQGNCLFKVMEQEACQYYTVQYYVTLHDIT